MRKILIVLLAAPLVGHSSAKAKAKRAAFILVNSLRQGHGGGTMSTVAGDFEKLGQFYLGRAYDPEKREASGDLLLYDSKDLVTHGVVLGMTGSGKTGLCLALLEEAAIDGLPAIVIDPKGDISNLLLTFPGLDAASFRPWINEDDAARKGLDLAAYAEQTAAVWKNGLAAWGQDGSRIQALRDAVDLSLYTPGSSAGLPVSILASLEAPPAGILDDAEMLAERVESTVSSLLSLVGVDADPIQSPEAVLLANIFLTEWRAGRNIELERLVRLVQAPPFEELGVLELDTFMPAKARQGLSLRFNNLLASPGFATWLEGEPLDVGRLLHTPAGKPRIAIFSIAHLGDSERMFFVSLLLNQLLGWMRGQSGTTSLRAMFYMDEIFGYLPPSANPPSKKPLMTLLKQSRAFGLGCLLATQNPVDLDYKALSNIGTWFLGRLQTERDKLRVLDGLEGAAASQNGRFDRRSMETLISSLGNRVFLMNNVHEDGPVVFEVRWVMSYLRGPLTRDQIRRLTGERPPRAASTSPPPAAHPMAMPQAPAGEAASTGRPVVGPGVREFFASTPGDGGPVVYQPFLLRVGVVHFSSAKAGVETSRRVRLAHPVTSDGIDWQRETAVPDALDSKEPAPDARFGALPGFAMNAANYRQVEKEFAEWLYREQRLELFHCPDLKAWSNPGESEGEFRVRLSQRARELRDEKLGKLRQEMARKIDGLADRLRTAEVRLAKEQSESTAAKMQAGASLLGGLLGAVFGRKAGIGTLTRGTSTIGKANTAYKQHQDVALASAKVGEIQAEIDALRQAAEDEAARIAADCDPSALTLETQTLKPTRSDVKVECVGLLWLAAPGESFQPAQ